MKTNSSSKKSGAVLVIVVSIMVAFTLLVAALLQLGSFNERETIRQLRTTQARWVAEAGLERALSWVMASYDYRGSLPDTLDSTETLLAGLGSYSVEVSSAPTANPLVDKYTIISTGIVSNSALSTEVIVQLTMEAAPGGQQGLLSLGGDTVIKNSDVFGDIYQAPPGTVHFTGGGNGGEGTIDAEGGVTGSQPSGLVEGDLPDPDPGPWIDPDDYAGQLATAASTNASDAIQPPGGTYIGTFNLTGGTNFVNGNIVLNADVTGSGTIVADGTVSFGANGVDIDDNVTIIAANNISVNKNNTTLGENVQLITMTDFNLSNNQDYPNPGVTIIAIGNVNVDANMKGFKGIIYAGGKVTFSGGVQDLEGAIIAWNGIDLGSNASITYNPDMFANPNPIDYGDSLAIQTDSWEWQENP
ncbi:MAG: hypothetical protein JEZ10_05185 [Verrucomicrobia bacterium]|nr:hypothetical protein [Verrucomicrobiota bacterium]